MSTSTPNGFTEAVMSWQRDMPLTPQKMSQSKRVGWRLVHRLSMNRGAVTKNQNDGTPIVDMIQSTTNAQQANALRAAINAECLKDVSVKTCHVAVTLTPVAGGGASCAIAITAFGDFGAVKIAINTLPDGTLAAVVT